MRRRLRPMAPSAQGPTALWRWHDPNRFRRRVVVCLWWLTALYAVYAVGAMVALEPGTWLAYRLVMAFGMATFPLPVLVAPAVFVAASDYFDLYGTMGPRVRRRHWTLLGLLALGAYAVASLGPAAFDQMLEAVRGPYHAVSPEGVKANSHARLMAPIAVALFVVVAGVAGAVVGHSTMGLARSRRFLTRWVACFVLVATFWATLVGVDELIVMHGVLSPAWLAVAPPAVPFLLACVLAREHCLRIGEVLLERIGYRRDRMDPHVLDHVVTLVAEADDPDQAVSAMVAEHDADREMVTLVAGIRRVAAPGVAVSERQVRQVVSAAIAYPAATRRYPVPWLQISRQWAETAGAFAGSWACLSAGLLLLGGAAITPPTIVSAAVAGFIGAAATAWMWRRDLSPAVGPATLPS